MVVKWTKNAIINFVEDNGYQFIEFVKYDKYKSRIKIWCKNIEEILKLNLI